MTGYVVSLDGKTRTCSYVVTNPESGDQCVEMRAKKIAIHYLIGWFSLDALAAIPVEWIILWSEMATRPDMCRGCSGPSLSPGSLVQTTKALKMLRLLRLTKILRLLRISRVFHCVHFIREVLVGKLELNVADWAVKLLQIGAALLITVHWLGCANVVLVKLYK